MKKKRNRNPTRIKPVTVYFSDEEYKLLKKNMLPGFKKSPYIVSILMKHFKK